MTDVWSLIDDTAKKYGEDPAVAKQIAQIESGGKNIGNSAGGSAAGVFQFMPDTWKQYGNGADPYDVAANVDAGIRLMRDNRAALKGSLGRDPTGGELYLAHQQGAGGASSLLKNPDANAASLVGLSHVNQNGGNGGMTAAQFASKWTSRIDGGGEYVPPTTHMANLYGAGGLINHPPEVADVNDPYANDTTGLQGLSDMIQAETTAHLLRGATAPIQPDPSWLPSGDTLKQLGTDPKTGQTLPPEYLSMLGNSVSEAHAKWIADKAWEDYGREQRLATLGWGGTLPKLVLGALDPANLGLMVATGGALNPLESALMRTAPGRIAAGALNGGISNVAIVAALQASGNAPAASTGDYLSAMGMGMALGGAFGAFSRHPATKDMAPDLHEIGLSLRNKALEGHPDVAAPTTAKDLNVGAKGVQLPANDFVMATNPAVVTRPALDVNAGRSAVGEAFNDTARAQGFSINPNAGQSAIRSMVANDTVPHLDPRALIEDHAATANPELWGRMTAADSRVAELQQAVEQYTSKAPHAVQDELANLREAIPGAKGKKLDELVARAREIEKAHPELIGKPLSGEAQSLEQQLRTALNDAKNERAKIGPELKAAREASAKWLGEDPDGPLIPLGEAHKTLGPGERPGPARVIRELRASNDTTGAGKAKEAPRRSAEVLRAANDILTPEKAQVASYVKATQAVMSGKDDRVILSAANDPRGYAAPPSPTGSTVGAAHNPHAVMPLFTQQGEWADVRDNGQFTLRPSIRKMAKNPLAAELVLPASGTQLAASPFAEHRIAGAYFGGNPIGYHTDVNPVDAYLVMGHRYDNMQGKIEAALKPAFKDWADRQGHGPIDRNFHTREFHQQVHDYILGIDPTAEPDPAVKQFGDAVRKVTEEWRKLANELKLTELPIEADPTYLPRIGDAGKINEHYNKFGVSNLAEGFFKAMRGREWAAELTDDEVRRIATGYTEGMSRRALELDDKFNEAYSGHDLGHLRTLLMQDAGMADHEASALVDKLAHLANKEEGETQSPRMKHRIDMDMATSHEVPGVGSFNIRDLFIKDTGELMRMYNRHMAGRTALAETKIVDPDTGNLLVDGIRNQGDFDRMLKHMRGSIQDHYVWGQDGKVQMALNDWQKKGEDNLRFIHDRILGRPMNDFNRTKFGQAARLARMFSFDRIMGATGWSHLSMYGAVLSHSSIQAFLGHSPLFRNFMRDADGHFFKSSGLTEELEAIFGNHTDPLRGLQMREWDVPDSATPLSQRDTLMGKAEKVLKNTNRITAVASGLSHIIHTSKQWAYRLEAQRFAKWAHEAKEVDGKLTLPNENMMRLRQLGLSEDDLQHILREMKTHATMAKGIFFDHKLVKLNLDNWDQTAAHRLQYAIKRTADRLVQENDAGSMNRYSTSPVWQLLMQFRSFPMVGHTKQLAYNLNMADKRSLYYFMVTSAMGALIYNARVKVNSMFRDDRDQYLEKMLSPHNVAHAAVYHSGFGGMAPTFIDTGLSKLGFDPWFDYRASGQAAGLEFPALSLWHDFDKAVQGIKNPIAEGRSRSQLEMRNIARMLPFNNTLPATLLTNALTRGAPPKPPMQQRPH